LIRPEPWPRGTRVEKVGSHEGDGHKNGALATISEYFGPIPADIIGSTGEVIPKGTFGYFVYWDDLPGVPVFVAGHRIRPVAV